MKTSGRCHLQSTGLHNTWASAATAATPARSSNDQHQVAVVADHKHVMVLLATNALHSLSCIRLMQLEQKPWCWWW